jgi:hypothetical protein
MELLARVKRLYQPVRGVKPSFRAYHVFIALTSLRREGPLGRMTLSRKLELGEAAVKTLVRRLRDSGLATVDRVAGVLLTEEGVELAEFLEGLMTYLGPVELGPICGGCRTYGLVLRSFRGVLESVGYLKLRDLVVREGADGALIVYCGDRPVMPVSGGFEEVTGALGEVARRSCGSGDVLVVSICCSNSRECSRAPVEAALDLLDP